MPQCADCYFLVNSRSAKLVDQFLDKYLPLRSEVAIDYVLLDPEEGAEFIVEQATEAMNFLENNPTHTQQIYWQNLDQGSKIAFGMVFYTDDEKMILGVSIPADHPVEPQVIMGYVEIETFLKPVLSCITMEEPPPSNAVEFELFCELRFTPLKE